MLIDLLEWDKKIWDAGEQLFAFDEAGYGCFAGSLFVAGVIFNPLETLPPDLLKVRDSKKLNEDDRFFLEEGIRRHAKHIWLHKVSPEEINRGNIYWLRYAAAENHAQEYVKRNPQTAFVFDGNVCLKIGAKGRSLCLKKGDNISFSIAAASILAKTAKDRESYELDRLYPEYGFARHKGYGTAEHREALRKMGMSPVHRHKFCQSTLNGAL